MQFSTDIELKLPLLQIVAVEEVEHFSVLLAEPAEDVQ